MWYDYANNSAYVADTYTVEAFELQAGGSSGYGHYLLLQNWLHTDNPDGSGNFYSYAGAAAPINSGTPIGFDFNQYRFINFDLVMYIWTQPTNGSLIYKMILVDYNGETVEQEFSAPSDWYWYTIQLNMSDFTLPTGAAYTAAQVISNVTELRWEAYAASTSSTDWGESVLYLDNINLEK